MSKYNCKTSPLSSLAVTPLGVIMPLCTSCNTKDCKNPIENKVLTILGTPTNVRLLSVRGEYKMVIDCQGYSVYTEQRQDQTGDVQGFQE